ncbi:MAG: AI-2E family transporter [Clostridia bacterium]|nr:AI-2E family transporter [Clostridia bacterium]
MERGLSEYRKTQIATAVIMALLLFTIWYMLDLVLLTFFIAFITYHFVALIQRQILKHTGKYLPNAVGVVGVYLLYVVAAVLVSIKGLPKLADQITWIALQLFRFDIKAFEKAVSEITGLDSGGIMATLDINSHVANAGAMLADFATAIGGTALNLCLAMMLALVILIEKNKIRRFGENLQHSRISAVYMYLVRFGGNFCNTFGKVMKVQVTIAFINSLISMAGLYLIGFSSIPSLGLMIFCLGLIPVAGVIISMIPLSILAFSIGGIIKVAEVFVMIVIIHAIETYILNPKLMSNKTRLPVSFVFVILIVSEHYLGTWGLLIGVPIFIFIMNLFQVDYAVEDEPVLKDSDEEKKSGAVRKAKEFTASSDAADGDGKTAEEPKKSDAAKEEKADTGDAADTEETVHKNNVKQQEQIADADDGLDR